MFGNENNNHIHALNNMLNSKIKRGYKDLDTIFHTVQEFIADIVYDNNYLRPSYTLNYKTPIEYKIQLGFN